MQNALNTGRGSKIRTHNKGFGDPRVTITPCPYILATESLYTISASIARATPHNAVFGVQRCFCSEKSFLPLAIHIVLTRESAYFQNKIPRRPFLPEQAVLPKKKASLREALKYYQALSKSHQASSPSSSAHSSGSVPNTTGTSRYSPARYTVSTAS